MRYSSKVVGKTKKNLSIYHDKIITKYAPDKIDFNRICRV